MALGLVCFILVLLGVVWGISTASKRRMETEAFLREHGFSSLGNRVPAGLQPPLSVWTLAVKVRDCWAGSFNDFECAVFTTHISQGEAVTVRSAVAVRRPASAAWASNLHMTTFLRETVTLDVASTPGWVLASMSGGMPRRQVVAALLQALCKR